MTASLETHFRLTNNTPFNITRIWVTDSNSDEWVGVSHPDRNLNERSLKAYSSLEEREELNYWKKAARFRLHMEFETGDVFWIDIYQYDSYHNYTRELGRYGKDAGKFIVSQVSGNKWNKITIFRRVPKKSWMENIPGSKKLSELNIPGTHETCALYGGPGPECQTMSLKEQLNAGIRFIDIRCRHIKNAFTIHHAAYYQHKNFRDVLNDCISFLNEQPQETIIMFIQPTGTREDCTRDFDATFLSYLKDNESMWYLDKKIPTLDEVRGKIVLIRRFDMNKRKTLGIDVTNWKENTTFFIDIPYAQFRVQDFYKLLTYFNIDEKWNMVESFMNEAQKGAMEHWYLNYASASQGATPKSVANKVNPYLFRYMDQVGSNRVGTILMDFPNEPKDQIPILVEKIIATNKFSV
ncbi:phosphatidylinositol-specific phospholipase C [Pseudalkalibacillus sp. SCS-8]|uniref:phosphatidylinositol-specific phospholipase C n=1 Tax=Pseudalkalibacillus nanhaiensis TaxID=3115291 RepID=UPI0032DA5486